MKLTVTGTGPTVVKLAGLAGGVGLYQEEIRAAVEAGFRVAAIDTAGDRWDDPASEDLSWEFLSDEVCRGLDALGVARAVLWGTSFGCLVALATASRDSGRVGGLLLCHPPDPRARPRYHLAGYRWAARRKDPIRATNLLFVSAFRAMASWELIYPTVLWRIPALTRCASEAATPPLTIQQKVHLLLTRPAGLPPPEALMQVSIIAGRWDTITTYKEALNLSRALSCARLRTVRFSGHASAYSRPRAYHRMLVEELRRLCSAEAVTS